MRQIAIAVILLATVAGRGAGATAIAPAGATTDSLLQHTSGGHALGFGSGGYYVSNGIYALRVRFDSAQLVAPVREDSSHKPDIDDTALARVSYSNLWSGISVTYDFPPAGIARSVWTLEPGVDPRAIRLLYNRELALADDGSLRVPFDNGSLSESRPIAWQDVDGHREPVAVNFVLLAENLVSFDVGSHRRDLPLTIDPTLTWNTFLGGSDWDRANAIAVDREGNVYVAGTSEASWGTPLRPFSGIIDGLVAKLSDTGVLQWHTFLGSSLDDRVWTMALDGDGNIFVAGSSEANWGTPLVAYNGGYRDAFAAKLTAAGAIEWNTFLGALGSDLGYGIAVAESGSIYVAGRSDDTWGSPVRAHAGSPSFDGFAAQLAADGTLIWNTFQGGSGDDLASAVALDDNEDLYLVGWSDATWGSPIRTHAADTSYDVYVAKLGIDGALSWNTFLGGTSEDLGYGITVSGKGVYVTGSSNATWGSPLHALTGGTDVFVARLALNGVLRWNTFWGSDSTDVAYGIASDSDGNVYIPGSSNATWGSPARAYTGDDDAFAAKITADGALEWNTFLGGSGNDVAFAVTDDERGHIYVAGFSGGTWGSPVRSYTSGALDAFAAFVTRDRHHNSGCQLNDPYAHGD